MKHIFVIDDEMKIRNLIKKYLEKEGYKVACFSNAQSALQEIETGKPDLLVLDIMMPGTDGLELCRLVRSKSELPIIFVSAKDEEFDKVLGLELGADDYLTKPFSPRELVARVKNIFRRLDKARVITGECLVAGDLKLVPARRYVEKDGVELKLTTREYDLFEFLFKNKSMPFTREQLLDKIWGYNYFGDERVVDDLVKRLRKKLKAVNSVVEITTIWGYGYRLDG